MRAEAVKIVLGTRGSQLARAQASLVENAIRTAQREARIETRIIASKGDTARVIDFRAGRKGLFTAELERVLLAGEIDVAVHSAKDLPSETHPDAQIAATLPRAPINDVLISKNSGGLASLPKGAAVGTGSVRRQHQLSWKRPDIKIVDLRGNVPTRLRKFANSNWHAIVLACAGLDRLELRLADGGINFEGQRYFVESLSAEIFLPAAGQGIIAIQIRRDDEPVRAALDHVNDRRTLLCLRAEREFLRLLQADCNSPVGVLAVIENGKMRCRAQVFDRAATPPREGEVEGDAKDGELLAAQLLRQINGRVEADHDRGYEPKNG